MNATTTPPTTTAETPAATDGDGRTASTESRALAERLCQGFVRHDRGDRDGAVAAFAAVDRGQFPHLDGAQARASAEAYVDALWAKDDLEAPHADGGSIVDRESVAAADWSAVRDALARRADVVGMPGEYARATTEAWRQHKAGGDYWTPTLRAQQLEVRAATGDPDRPRKRSDGRSGPGHLAARYLVCVELHDMHTEEHWEGAVEVLVGYFDAILAAHGGKQ